VRLAVGAPPQRPVAIGLDRGEEVVGDAHRVVGVLARDGEVGLGIPVGVVGREIDRAVALLGELDHAQDVVVRDHRRARAGDRRLERLVGARVEAGLALRAVAGGHDRVEMLVGEARAGDQRGHLLLLDHLPVDVVLDVGVVDVDGDHLGRAARGAARLDRARGAVADLEEAHQPRRLAAAREPLALAAQLGEVGAGARAVFEQPRLAHPEVHDPALVDEIVLDRLDEAGVRLRVLVGRRRRGHLAAAEVDEPVALARAVDAVGPVQPGVEPLRRIGRGDLRGQHVAHLVEIGARVLLGVEVAALPAPVGPRAGEAIEDLLGRALAALALALGERGDRGLVGLAPPQPAGTSGSATGLSAAGRPRLRKYFCASTSQATCDHAAGTSMSRAWKTTDPSGLRISELVVVNARFA
jgi:hypothetical protein